MPTATAPQIYRRSVAFCVIPSELARLHHQLSRFFAETNPDVRVIVERRDAADRRQGAGAGPEGRERRVGQRRVEMTQTLADSGLPLPWSLRRYAARLGWTRRMIPVNFHNADAELQELFEAQLAGDASAAEELRLRTYPSVRALVGATVRPGRVVSVTDRVYDELSGAAPGENYQKALTHARERAIAR